MKKWKRPALILTAVAVAAAAWTWRYVTMNRYYDDLDNGGYALYQAGELVPFEDDYQDMYTSLDGYYIRVDGHEFVDYGTFLDERGLDIPWTEDDPDKLVLVYITVVNESCDPNPIVLDMMWLCSVDTFMDMDLDVLTAVNPILEGKTGVALQQGEECQLILPYGIRKEQFRVSTWRNIDDCRLTLQVTSALTVKESLVNA